MAQQEVDFRIQERKHLQEETPKQEAEISFSPKEILKELSRNIFSNDKAIKTYNSSKVKARNFLTNVSYNRISTHDFKNENFVIDCYTFMIIYLNPFYLERKFESIIEREFVSVLWSYLMPNQLYVFISSDANMLTLNKIKIKYQDGKNIIIAFVNNNAENMNSLSEFLAKNAILYQYLFANLFPKCFSRVDDYGIMAKTSFNKFYHSYHLQKNMLKLIKEEQEEEQEEKNGEQNKEIDSPINMTTLFDVENDENKENINPKLQFEQGKQQQQQQQQQEQQEQKQKQKQNNKRKIENDEQKKQKTQAKKQKREKRKKILLEKLNENTDKMLQIRGKK